VAQEKVAPCLDEVAELAVGVDLERAFVAIGGSAIGGVTLKSKADVF
jgi:hypothetical protein